MIDCNICKHKKDYDYCTECKHGELFERKNVSEPKKISVSNGKEYCGHCGYLSEYARGYKKFYCIRCGGLNLRSWKNREVEKMKVVTVSDLIKILDTKENRYGATGKPRMLNLSLNGNFAGSIESVKLDGYGDGLITDVTMEITSSKFTTTNADRIRSMSDEELAEFLVEFKNTFGEEYEGEASCMYWLQSEVE